MGTPKQEHDGFFSLGKQRNSTVGETLPTLVFVGVGGGVTHGEDGVEKKYASLCPLTEIAVVGRLKTKLCVEFLVDIH